MGTHLSLWNVPLLHCTDFANATAARALHAGVLVLKLRVPATWSQGDFNACTFVLLSIPGAKVSSVHPFTAANLWRTQAAGGGRVELELHIQLSRDRKAWTHQLLPYVREESNLQVCDNVVRPSKFTEVMLRGAFRGPISCHLVAMRRRTPHCTTTRKRCLFLLSRGVGATATLGALRFLVHNRLSAGVGSVCVACVVSSRATGYCDFVRGALQEILDEWQAGSSEDGTLNIHVIKQDSIRGVNGNTEAKASNSVTNTAGSLSELVLFKDDEVEREVDRLYDNFCANAATHPSPMKAKLFYCGQATRFVGTRKKADHDTHDKERNVEEAV